jgi:hypothetical protein
MPEGGQGVEVLGLFPGFGLVQAERSALIDSRPDGLDVVADEGGESCNARQERIDLILNHALSSRAEGYSA